MNSEIFSSIPEFPGTNSHISVFRSDPDQKKLGNSVNWPYNSKNTTQRIKAGSPVSDILSLKSLQE